MLIRLKAPNINRDKPTMGSFIICLDQARQRSTNWPVKGQTKQRKRRNIVAIADCHHISFPLYTLYSMQIIFPLETVQCFQDY